MSYRNVRQRIGDASALARYRVAQRVGLELQWEHQGAAPVTIWTERDGNTLYTEDFPEAGQSDVIDNIFSIPNQPNLTFTPRTGDKVTVVADGLLYFVKMNGVVGDFDSGFSVIVGRRKINQMGVPS